MDLSRIRYDFEGEDDEFNIQAMLDGERIGHAWGSRAGDTVTLHDLQVYEDEPDRSKWAALVRWYKGFRAPRRFRQHGIGGEILKLFLQRADSSGVREIKGSVMRDAIEKQPWLLSAYEKRGFTVTEPDDECLPDAAKMIVRRR